MKQILTFIFLQLFVLSLYAQDDLEINKYAEPGKAYAKCRIRHEKASVEKQAAKVLKFVETEWEVEIDTIYRDTFEGEDYQHVLIKEPTFQWVHYSKMSRNCLSTKPLDCVTLSYVEVPATYRTIYFGETDSFKLVEVERVVRQSRIEIVDEICVDLPIEEKRSRMVLIDENQNILYIKMAAGQWTKWREVLCSGPRGGSYVHRIKLKLRDDGFYKGPINNKMDKDLKAALIKFQKSKGLPIGQLDFETLKALGIRY